MSQKFAIISNYLLSGPVSPDSVFLRIGLIIAGISFVIGMLGAIFSHRITLGNNLIQRLMIAARWGGGLLLILLFLQQQDIEPFDMRLWPVVIAIPLIGYCIYAIIAYRRTARITVIEHGRRESYEKYLPTKKRK